MGTAQRLDRTSEGLAFNLKAFGLPRARAMALTKHLREALPEEVASTPSFSE